MYILAYFYKGRIVVINQIIKGIIFNYKALAGKTK